MNAFGTKAETLHALTGSLQQATIPQLYYFTVKHWLESKDNVLARIGRTFGNGKIAVRSSAINEDSATTSMAGAYQSILNVNASNAKEVSAAVETVLASYGSMNPMNQVLIQKMLESVALSGVAMTYDLTSGAPYYIINYDDESGKTDVITGGTGTNKTVVIHHDAHLSHVESQRVAAMLQMIREIESRFGGSRTPLDIEFAQTSDGAFHLLQVRRIAVRKNWNRAVKAKISETLEHLAQFIDSNSMPKEGVSGAKTILGQMPDWNPAELIGTRPSPLAISIFRQLISDSTWQQARATMGYRPVHGEPLMLILAGRPYIDVRNSFNSFLPCGLSSAQETEVIDAWTGRLAKHPEFHDKVEFEVAQTLVDFDFDKVFAERYSSSISAKTAKAHKEALRALTTRNVTTAKTGSLLEALAKINTLDSLKLEAMVRGLAAARKCLSLLDLSMSGALQFSIIARHAFMAESLLRSAVKREAWTQEDLDEFKASIPSVASKMGKDFRLVLERKQRKEEFLSAYGHLRPGTFDILSARYDQRESLFAEFSEQEMTSASFEHKPFHLSPSAKKRFLSLLKEAGLNISPEEILDYARLAIAGREHAKFVFTKSLSAAIEVIAEWGEEIGLTREHLAFLTIYDIANTVVSPVVSDPEAFFISIAESRRQNFKSFDSIRLNYLIRDAHDIMVIPLHRGAPNYVSRKKVTGNVLVLDGREPGNVDIFQKIVCIESADPGFDWIFTRGILGLITKFGGANSHMTIRCAELGLPAAIGVGEHTFEWLTKAPRVLLDCARKELKPVHA